MKKSKIEREIVVLKRKIYEQRQLITISRALHSELKTERLIDSIMEVALVHTHTLESALFMRESSNRGYFRLREGFIGFRGKLEPEEQRLPFESLLVSYWQSGGEERSIRSLSQMIPSEPILAALSGVGGEIVFPLQARGVVSGFLLFGEKLSGNPYSPEELEFLNDLTALGGIALENSRLYERVSVDFLTGLKNRSYFDSRLQQALNLARTEPVPLALLLLDIDHFKQLNDNYGHQIGDEVLRRVAALLQAPANCYPGYVACRYGGEEFAVIVEGGARIGAEIGEKLRSSVEESRPVVNGRPLSVTISVGVSSYHPEISKLDASLLIERADEALYFSKRNGRNRVKIYGE